jgi:microcystin-dependent protein
MWAGNFAPVGWAMCNGQLLPISENDALYTLLGTTYGGDGVSTFGVPDFRGRAPLHWGQGTGLSPYVIGQQSGVEAVTVLTTQMPAHNHSLALQCNKDASATSLTNGLNGFPGATGASTYAAQADGLMGALPGAGGITGGSQPHDNMQPFLAVTFIIATSGIYPSQS